MGIKGQNNKNLAYGIDANATNHTFSLFTWYDVSNKLKAQPRGARLSVPTATNNLGSIVGVASTKFPLFGGHGFVITSGLVTLFDLPGSISTVPTNISDSRTIIGYYDDVSGTHGFVSSPSGYQAIDIPESTDTEILSINTQNQVSGRFFNASLQHFQGFDLYLFAANQAPQSVQYPGAGDGVNMTLRAVNNKGNIVGNAPAGSTGQTAYVGICPPHTGACLF